MKLELDGLCLELNADEIAVILALYWARGHILPLSLLHPVERDYGKRCILANTLKEKGLVEVFSFRHGTILLLSETGKRIAAMLEQIARERGLL